MTAQRFIDPITRIFTNAGLVAVGYKFYFYQTGTTTPVTTYQDLALTIPNTNPVVSDSNGRLPNIFYSDLSLLKVVVKDANDNIVEGASTDPVGSSYSIASLNDLDVRPTSYWGLTTGTSTAYTLIANPSISSYNNTQTFVVQPHVDCGDNPTLIVSGLSALSWKKYTQQGTKVGLKANDLRAGQRYFCVNDGVDIVCLNPSSLPILSGSATALTIATGAVNLTNNSSSYAIDTEGSASTDDLDTISGGQDGQVAFIRSTADARNVVIKHNTGNIFNPARLDITLDLTTDIVELRYSSTLAKWIVVSKITSSDSSLQLLSTVSASNVASVEFNSSLITSAFSKYIIEMQNILPATNGAGLQLQVSTDNGSSYISSNYLGTVFAGGSTDGLTNYIASTARVNLCGNFNADTNWGASSGAGKGISGNLTIFNPSSSSNKIIEFSVSYQSILNFLQKSQGSSICNNSTTAINALKLFFSSGNIASGSFKLYGVK